MKNIYITTATIGILLTANLQAEEAALAVGTKFGTLGFGIDTTMSVTEKVNVRFNINKGHIKSYNQDKKYKDDGKFSLFSAGILADYHPFSNGFRLSSGLYYSNMDLDHKDSVLEKNVQIGDNKYDLTSNTKTHFQLDSKTIAPYLGLGFGNALSKGSPWSFCMDVGVLYQSNLNAKLSMSGTAIESKTGKTINLNTDKKFRNNLKKENDNADLHMFYPVISLGVSYRF